MEDNGFNSINKSDDISNYDNKMSGLDMNGSEPKVDSGFTNIESFSNLDSQVNTQKDSDNAFNSINVEKDSVPSHLEKEKTSDVNNGFDPVNSNVISDTTEIDSENADKGFISSNLENQNHEIKVDAEKQKESIKTETETNLLPMVNVAVEKEEVKDKEKEDQPIIYENNTEYLKQHSFTCKYFTINFPEREVKKVVIEMTTKDQGWCTHRNASGSWVDIEIYKVLGSKKVLDTRIIENFGVKEWFDYSVTIDKEHRLFKYMNSKYFINIVVRADWGWEISVQRGKCSVY
jgi:hypothetical protein